MTPAGFESIRVDMDPPVATITLDRPQALNAITARMLAELTAAFEWAGQEPSAVVVVLTGAGRAFSAGVDLKALGGRRLDGGKVGDVLDLPARLYRAAERLGLPDGLAYEAATDYPIDDTEARIAQFR